YTTLFRSQLNTVWHIETVGKYRFFVSYSIMIRVFQYQYFVIGHGTGQVLRIGRHISYPQSALWVKSDFDRIGQRKIYFRCKQINFETFRQTKRSVVWFLTWDLS